jgi:hypothetical protein
MIGSEDRLRTVSIGSDLLNIVQMNNSTIEQPSRAFQGCAMAAVVAAAAVK